MPRTTTTKMRRKTVKAPVRNAIRRKTPTPTLNGIPLRRKAGWLYDTNSAEFRAARKRDREAIKSSDWDRDGMQWVEALTNDPDWQKSWK
jgi:hypothetical protein